MGNDELGRTAIHHYPVIELVHGQRKTVEKVAHRLEQGDLGRVGLQAVIGGRAFREYHALSEKVGMNRAGNFRGMVVSARWKILFRHTSHVGEYMRNVGYLAALASGIVESAPTIESIVASSESTAVKGMRIAAAASTIAQRALMGTVPAGAHLIYRSLEGWCMMAGLTGGSVQSAASQCIGTLQYADTLVQTSFESVTDTNNQSKAIWSIIDFVTSPLKK